MRSATAPRPRRSRLRRSPPAPPSTRRCSGPQPDADRAIRAAASMTAQTPAARWPTSRPSTSSAQPTAAPRQLAVAAGRARLLHRPARQPGRRHPDRAHRHRRPRQALELHRPPRGPTRPTAASRNFFGLEGSLGKVLPGRLRPGQHDRPAAASTSSSGQGSVNRAEKISLTIAAVVTGVLPNGNLVIQGRQEVRTNDELRELTVSRHRAARGHLLANTIRHTQIAEARISYGGRGDLTRVNRPRPARPWRRPSRRSDRTVPTRPREPRPRSVVSSVRPGRSPGQSRERGRPWRSGQSEFLALSQSAA